jgi:hypothetical protein
LVVDKELIVDKVVLINKNSWLISKTTYQQLVVDKELIVDKVVLINKEPYGKQPKCPNDIPE